ncbi:MAG: hypothetical protein ACRC8O_00975 [Plesiomonas shigelloides]
MDSKNRCRRCHVDIDKDSRWCDTCFYPGIDQAYDEYQALLAEGFRRVQAAVISGWEDPVEAGAYIE